MRQVSVPYRLLLSVLFLCMCGVAHAQSSTPSFRYQSTDPGGACNNGTANRYNWTNNVEWGCKNSVWTIVNTGGGGGGGTVTSVAGSGPSWLTWTVTNPTTAVSISLAPTTGQTSHQVIGTCGSGTTFAPCALVLADLPAALFTLTTTGSSGAATYSGGVLNIPQYSGGGGANTALSNLASVSINTALIPQANIDVGSQANPFRTLYVTGISQGSSPPAFVAGTGAAQGWGEGTAPGTCAAASVDCIYASSVQHGFLASYNNGSYLPLVQGPASSTNLHIAQYSGTTGGLLIDLATTGTGNAVLATSPTLVTPTLGVAVATSINKVAFTAPASGSTLTIADGKIFTVNNTITLVGTDAQTYTFPTTTATIARTDAAQTFTGLQTFSSSGLKILGSSTGGDTFTSNLSGSTGYTITTPTHTANDTLCFQTAANCSGGSVANYYTSTTHTGIGPTSFTPVGTFEVFDNTATTGSTSESIKEGAGQSGSAWQYLDSSNNVRFAAGLFPGTYLTSGMVVGYSGSFQITNGGAGGGGNTVVSLGAPGDNGDLRVNSTGGVSWASGANLGVNGLDTTLSRVSAGIVGVGNGTLGDVTGAFKLAGIIIAGTKFTASGCSNGTTVGGATAGSFASGTTGACTVTVTMGNSLTAPNGWACWASDQTTPANTYDQKTGGSTTTAVFTGTTVSGDVISFGCSAY